MVHGPHHAPHALRWLTPATELIRGASSRHAVWRQPSNPSHGSSSPKPTACWATAPNFGPTWMTGTSGSSRNTPQQPSNTSRTPPEQATLSCNPARSISGRHHARTPSCRHSKTKLECLGAHLRILGDSDGSPVPWTLPRAAFQNISAILCGLNQNSDSQRFAHKAASQHALRMTFVPEAEANSFDTEIVALWSQLIGRVASSPLFHLPLRMGAWVWAQRTTTRCSPMDSLAVSHLPTLMNATDSPDTDNLFSASPILRNQLFHLQSTLARQMSTPARAPQVTGRSPSHTWHPKNSGQLHLSQPTQATRGQLHRRTHSLKLSSSPNHTRAHLQQPNSVAHEAGDRCFRVSLARRLMLAHPAASDPDNISPTCPYVSAAKRICACPIDAHQLHFMICKSGGGVDQRHSALARCLADLKTTHTGTKVNIEQTFPGLSQVDQPGAQPEGACMDVVFDVRGNTFNIDTAIVTLFSFNAKLISAFSARPGFMANREERESSAVKDGPICPRNHGKARLSRTKVHQTPLQ